MADIRIGVSGDASGGVAAMDDMGNAVGKSAVKWQEMANAAKAAAKAIVEFVKDSVKQYAESERIQRQLVRATGDYAKSIDEQSKALSRLYAVDDDIINQSATLLAQWGGAAAASREAETAALNLAAAYGGDLQSATQDLIRNVESGGTGLAKMGIHFEATGRKGEDLKRAIAAINEKLGGAAAADAGSLTGQLHAADLAFDDMKKSLGGSIAEMVRASGIVPRLTQAIRELNDSLFTPTATKQEESADFIAQQVQYWEDIAAGNVIGYKDFATQTQFTFEEAQAELAKWRAKLNPQSFNAAFSGSSGPKVGNELTNKGRKDAPDVIAHQESAAAHDTIFRHEEESAEHTYSKLEKLRMELAKSSADGDEAEAKRAAERQAKQDADTAKLEEKALKDQNDRTAKKAHEAAAAGDAIGAAMVNALADQLAKLAEGGEFDAALFVGDIMAAAVGVAGGIIGTALGAPAVGAAVGNLAAMGVRAGASAISRGNKKARARTNTYHDGGWVDAPRHHDGAWIGPDEQRAILQTNERVLSRREVATIGGPAAVDRMAKGGGGLTLNVTAIDAKSMADTFSGSGADGLKQALRRGHGSLPSLLGRGPR